MNPGPIDPKSLALPTELSKLGWENAVNDSIWIHDNFVAFSKLASPVKLASPEHPVGFTMIKKWHKDKKSMASVYNVDFCVFFSTILFRAKIQLENDNLTRFTSFKTRFARCEWCKTCQIIIFSLNFGPIKKLFRKNKNPRYKDSPSVYYTLLAASMVHTDTKLNFC